MDRIRTALDLAREERQRGSDQESRTRPKSGRAAALGLPANIEYSTTRVFRTDAKRLEANRIVDPNVEGDAANAFRMLRTQVIQRMDEHGWRSLAVLSPTSDDGKTTTTINLAISMANDRRHTVLLVDCDLKRPMIAATLGMDIARGVDDVLRGEATVDQCLIHPEGYDRLVVLPARAALANSSEILAGPRGRAFVEDLRSRYPERIIIFDLPPVLGADDALAFLPLIDCGLIVVAERHTKRDDLLRGMELLRKTPILGTVLNKATAVNAAYE